MNPTVTSLDPQKTRSKAEGSMGEGRWLGSGDLAEASGELPRHAVEHEDQSMGTGRSPCLMPMQLAGVIGTLPCTHHNSGSRIDLIAGLAPFKAALHTRGAFAVFLQVGPVGCEGTLSWAQHDQGQAQAAMGKSVLSLSRVRKPRQPM